MTTIEIIQLLSGLLTAFGGSLIAWSTFKKLNADKKKVFAETDQISAQTVEALADTTIKLNAESRKIYDQLKKELSQDLECQSKQIKELTRDVVTLQKEKDIVERRLTNTSALIGYLLKGIKILIQQLQQENITPDWIPDGDIIDKLSC